MKKSLIIAASIIVTSACVMAANLQIGTINTQQIIQNYSGAAVVQQELDQKKAQLQEVMKTEQDNLTTEQNALNQLGTKATPDQVKAFQDAQQQFQTDYQTMQQELSQYQQEQMQQLKNTIATATQTVSLTSGYPIVLDSQAVLYGGTNISSQVLKALNGMQSISLDD
ncbi:MAG: OmpH family outer membrane protein [Fusobacteria bacterium]|nr:OmpH family outer membrane protein [Fusobacteriota bacterium]